MRIGDIDPASLAQSLEHAGMVHEDMDERLAIDSDGFAGTACAILPLMQGLELIHGGVKLEKGAAAHGTAFRSAGTDAVSTSGMFQTSAPAAA
ncbi:hypothetical protein MesoLj113b_70900 (plasmid) [Mesorhizobium sp. 113-3-3]|nr:hypothetical protein MesoLj113b_70900 [Mesorhizobium sp. 113-3-3]